MGGFIYGVIYTIKMLSKTVSTVNEWSKKVALNDILETANTSKNIINY